LDHFDTVWQNSPIIRLICGRGVARLKKLCKRKVNLLGFLGLLGDVQE